MLVFTFFFQAEDGIRDLVRSRGLGDVYKRQAMRYAFTVAQTRALEEAAFAVVGGAALMQRAAHGLSVRAADLLAADRGACLLYTSDAADERSSVDLGGRRIIKKKKQQEQSAWRESANTRYDIHIYNHHRNNSAVSRHSQARNTQ